MDFLPTDEQRDIIEAALTIKDSLLVDAHPGSGKTTLLEMIAAALPVEPILSIAFNRRIVEEMTKRLPGHCKCQTANSVGHRAWQPVVGTRLMVEKDKTYKIVKSIIDGLPRSEIGEAYDVLSSLCKAVSLAKTAGYIPEGIMPHAMRLTENLDDALDDVDDLNGFDWIVDQALKESIRLSYASCIDYADQIYMPTLFGGQFPRFKRILLDEVQDFNPLMHIMVKKLYNGWMAGVGDPRQSIYAFNGAVPSSMAQMKQTFDLKEMPLSISFRCPQAVVRRAWFRAPAMRWPAWAKEGAVTELDGWDAQSVPDGAAIVCRNNAPLFKIALALLRESRGIQLVGFDIGPNLVRTLRKLGDDKLAQGPLLAAIDTWEMEQLRKGGERKAASICDRAECLRVFARQGTTLGAATAYAESLFKVRGPIQLLSIHKAKGLEWDTVYHLDPWRVPSKFALSPEAKEQELNIRYVGETRPKDTLFLANAEAFE